MNVIPLVNKSYVNEVTLADKNLYKKSFQSSELKICILRRLRSFQRGTMDLCRSKEYKITSYQSWRFEKKICLSANYATRPGSPNPTQR